MSQKNTKSKNGGKNRKKKGSSGFSCLSFLMIVVIAAAVCFVACERGGGNEENVSGAMKQSGVEESIEESVEESVDESKEISTEESNSEESKTEASKDESSSAELSTDSSEDDKSEDADQSVSPSVDGEKYSSVPHFKSENGKRYDKYGEKNPNYTLEQVVTYVNIGLDSPYYTNTYKANKDDGIFILVNKYSYIDRSFTPDNLVELDDSCKVSGKSVKLVKEAADAFKKLSDDARALEYYIIGMSGYRTYAYQESLYNRYLQNDTQENVDTYSARPGYSEHHTGLALDVQTDSVSFSNFGQTKEYEWLLDNAHRYGFVIHYTSENQWITGYMPEEWHIRYLGVEAATYIYDNNLSVDEYLVMFGAKGPDAMG